MNTTDLVFRYTKELGVEGALGIIGATSSITFCLIAASTQPIQSNMSIYQFAVSGIAFLIVATLFSLCMISELLTKRQEIGILRALGAGRRIVAAIFLTKAILIGILGSIFGIAFGYAFTALTYGVGQQYNSAESILRALTIGSAGSIIGGLYVAIRASRMNIVEAIRS